MASAIEPFAGEPSADPWRRQSIVDLLTDLRVRMGSVAGRPLILAVDGRQGGGKSTLAARIAEHVVGAVIVHTDDVAWWESFFGWDHLMADGILEPLRRGAGASFRPPAWRERDRAGAIEVPAGAPMVIIEGVGSSRTSLAGLLDAAVWVQSDYVEATRRGIARDGGAPEHATFWEAWAAEENPFLARDRPWERAAAVVCGTPGVIGIAHDPSVDVLRGRTLAPDGSGH